MVYEVGSNDDIWNFKEKPSYPSRNGEWKQRREMFTIVHREIFIESCCQTEYQHDIETHNLELVIGQGF